MTEKRNVITDGLLYINGTHLLAKVKEYEPPEITQQMAECEDLASLGKYKLPTLKVDELSSKITLNSFYKDIFKQFANPLGENTLALQYSVMEYENQTMKKVTAGRIVLRATAEKLKAMADLKGQTPSDYTIELNHTMISHTYGGSELYYLDMPNRIWRVGGVDILAEINAALGLT